MSAHIAHFLASTLEILDLNYFLKPQSDQLSVVVFNVSVEGAVRVATTSDWTIDQLFVRIKCDWSLQPYGFKTENWRNRMCTHLYSNHFVSDKVFKMELPLKKSSFRLTFKHLWIEAYQMLMRKVVTTSI